MKKFCLLFVGVIALVLISCESIPPQPTGIDRYRYVFKKKHGKVLTGVEETYTNGKSKLIIPIEYDKITTGFNSFFIVHKNNEAKLMNLNGGFWMNGMSIDPESIIYMGNNFVDGHSFIDGPVYKMKTKEGEELWWFDHQYHIKNMGEIIPCRNGAVFKKNGKYGYFEFKVIVDRNPLQYTYKEIRKFKVIVEEKYDALYEVSHFLSNNYCLLAKLGSKWFVLNSKGEVMKRHHPKINTSLLKIPMTTNFSMTYLNPEEHIAHFGRKDAGAFIFGLSLRDWNESRVWNNYFK